MLRKFTVTNYKNFEKETCLDLTDVRKYDFNTECVKDGILNKAVVLGRNGAGKTNLGLALFDIAYTLTDIRPHHLQTNETSFLNGNSKERFATFKYEFVHENSVIQYEYRKNTPGLIVYESLVVDDKLVFLRDGINGKTDYSGLRNYGLGSLNLLIPNGPLAVLKYIYGNTIPNPSSPITFVVSFAAHMLYYRSVQDGNQYIGLTNSPELIDQFIMSHGLVEEFQKFLLETGGIDVKLQRKRIPGMQDVLVQKFNNRLIPFYEISSSGTKALTLFFYWSKYFGDISLLFMDEFDAYYHSDLAEKILKEVIGRHEFQSILTTHNTDLVDNNLMRPDCYLILNKKGIKSMPERTERELREGHNLRKLLRGGEFDE